MKITILEKIFVNRENEVKKNLNIADKLFKYIDLSNVSNILEIGCGIGLVCANLTEKYKWNVIGIDVDPEQIEIAKKKYIENDKLRFFIADATKLSFEDNEFEIILSFDVLHHISTWDKVLNEVKRTLKPGGYFLINDVTLPKFTSKIFKSSGVFSAKDISDYLQKNNFNIIHEENSVGILKKLAGRVKILAQKI